MDDPKDILRRILEHGVRAVAPEAEGVEIHLERPKNPEHGDYASNVALQLSKQIKRKPREIAQLIIAATRSSFEDGIISPPEIAGAGFLNFRLKSAAKLQVVHRVLAEAQDYGRGRPARQESVQVEFVSANPTGPLHVGHGRGAAYGASLASLLEFAGHRVAREFYVNDAGRQMDILALSVWLRYLQARGSVVPFPDDGYRGDYVIGIAARLADAHVARFVRDAESLPQPAPDADPDAALDALIAAAKSLLGEDWRGLHRFALEEMLADQRDDLARFLVGVDRWFSEQCV